MCNEPAQLQQHLVVQEPGKLDPASPPPCGSMQAVCRLFVGTPPPLCEGSALTETTACPGSRLHVRLQRGLHQAVGA